MQMFGLLSSVPSKEIAVSIFGGIGFEKEVKRRICLEIVKNKTTRFYTRLNAASTADGIVAFCRLC